MGLTTDPNDPRLGRDPEGGMNEVYLVLSDEERAKGFIRPLRLSYIHHTPKAEHELQDLTEEQAERYAEYGYVKYEPYPPSESSVVGRFWTQEQLDRAERGCGCVTTMAPSIAETYARQPDFYGATYCACCGKHYPVGQVGEFTWVGPDGEDTGIKVGT